MPRSRSFRPSYGPGSDATPFQPSTTLWMDRAQDGWVHHNDWHWKCSFMDLDVSDRVVFEDNTIADTEPHISPHGTHMSLVMVVVVVVVVAVVVVVVVVEVRACVHMYLSFPSYFYTRVCFFYKKKACGNCRRYAIMLMLAESDHVVLYIPS